VYYDPSGYDSQYPCKEEMSAGAGESGTPSSKIDYKEVFFKEHPELRGEVWVHHGVEQQVLTKPQTKGLFSYEEMHSLDNLRGIPKEINSDLHLSKIRKEWNKFYKEFPNPTKEQLLQKRLDIDKKYGHLFKPPIDVE
jgi:rhs-family protein